MKPLNYIAKEFLVIKESRPVRNATKRIKQILDAEYNKLNVKNNNPELQSFKVQP